ncbi:MAG: cation-translocating P-type ATPase [Provencibacterium sp.]|nr:cation-translocating P-type ATPase [Provencibacterium sp.]
MEKYQGLSSKQAGKLLEEYGENRLKAQKKTGALGIFAGQFRDALIMILLAATVLSVLMGDIAEALTIIAIVFLNALLGFLQEYRTEKTLEKLGELSAPSAAVVRDGAVQRVDARQVVPGDILLLQAGARVAADAEVLESTGLMCDESMLSGESAGVEKQPGSGAAGKVYMGTLVTRGKGVCRVTKTGQQTEMGGIAGMLGSIETQQTPLQKRLAQLSKWIGIGCLFICGAVALTGILRGEPVMDMLLTGISLSVAAVPEGLPAIVTIALALSVGRMVKRNALVRRLHAVETLGCANVICSDKTGTLTENKMTVTRVRTPQASYEVSGSGYRCEGELTRGGRRADTGQDPALLRLLEIAAVCNNASLSPGRGGRQKKGQPEILGEPTEAALLVLAAKGGISREKSGYAVEREIPFDSTRKMMSVLARAPGGERLLMMKGAPDLLLQRCTFVLEKGGIQPLTPQLRRRILEENNRFAADALRVLGFCFRKAAAGDLYEGDMVFVGLAGLIDPPRKEAYDAVLKCRRAGIKPVMITGDHAVTARAIAKQLSIFREGDRVVTGQELDDLNDRQLKELLPKISVFARVTPAHKLRIVRAFKAQGNVVAMTGDGVNDAPAVKEADIGVSMGVTGTDVTKEAASVILLDDNFATLVYAVEEGRAIYQNIRKFIRYLLSCNIGEVFTMFFAMLAGMPVPLIPIQILLVNLVTDGLPAIALGLEPAERDVMDQPPRGAGESVFSRGLAGTIITRGLLIGLTTVSVFVSLLQGSGSLQTARTGALLTLVSTQLIHVFECKSETRGLFSINPFDNPALLGAAVLSAAAMYFALYNPFLAKIFFTAPLTGSQLFIVFSCCLAVPAASGLIAAVKNAGRRRMRGRPGKLVGKRV